MFLFGDFVKYAAPKRLEGNASNKKGIISARPTQNWCSFSKRENKAAAQSSATGLGGRAGDTQASCECP